MLSRLFRPLLLLLSLLITLITSSPLHPLPKRQASAAETAQTYLSSIRAALYAARIINANNATAVCAQDTQTFAPADQQQQPDETFDTDLARTLICESALGITVFPAPTTAIADFTRALAGLEAVATGQPIPGTVQESACSAVDGASLAQAGLDGEAIWAVICEYWGLEVGVGVTTSASAGGLSSSSSSMTLGGSSSSVAGGVSSETGEGAGAGTGAPAPTLPLPPPFTPTATHPSGLPVIDGTTGGPVATASETTRTPGTGPGVSGTGTLTQDPTSASLSSSTNATGSLLGAASSSIVRGEGGNSTMVSTTAIATTAVATSTAPSSSVDPRANNSTTASVAPPSIAVTATLPPSVAVTIIKTTETVFTTHWIVGPPLSFPLPSPSPSATRNATRASGTGDAGMGASTSPGPPATLVASASPNATGVSLAPSGASASVVLGSTMSSAGTVSATAAVSTAGWGKPGGWGWWGGYGHGYGYGGRGEGARGV